MSVLSNPLQFRISAARHLLPAVALRRHDLRAQFFAA
jgi:hypothetical protein